MNPHALDVGDLHRQLPVLEPNDGILNDRIRALSCFMFMEFNVLDPFDSATRIGGEKLGPVTVRHFCEPLLDALHVYAHGIHSARR
jgi:hypothetical protein